MRFLVVPITSLYILAWGFLPITALAQDTGISSPRNTIQTPTKNTNPPISSGEAKAPETCSTGATPIITPINTPADAGKKSTDTRYIKREEKLDLNVYVCDINQGNPASTPPPNTGAQNENQKSTKTGQDPWQQDVSNKLGALIAAQKPKNTLVAEIDNTDVSVSIKPASSGNSNSSGNSWIATVTGNGIGRALIVFRYGTSAPSQAVTINVLPRMAALSVGAGFGAVYKAQSYSSVPGPQPTGNNVIAENDTLWPSSLISLAHVRLTSIPTGVHDPGFMGLWGSLGIDTSSKNIDLGISFSPSHSDQLFFTVGLHPETTQQLILGSTGASIVTRNVTAPRLFLSVTADTSIIGKLFGGSSSTGSASTSSTSSSSGQ
jgi:hypothetical protein